MRGGFNHYRAFKEGNEQIKRIAAQGKTQQPILAISGGVIGDALADQLEPISANLTRAAIPDSSHIIPCEQPKALATALIDFLRSK